jgi:hypothetical protein
VAHHLHAHNLGRFSTFSGQSQIDTLTPYLSFGHNLCCKYSNESCQLILNMYVFLKIQWYKDVFNLMNFDLSNRSLNIWDSKMTPTPKVGVHLGVCGLIPSHSRECEYGFWIAFSACTFPCLYLDHEPKAKVVTLHAPLTCFIYKFFYYGSILKDAMFECGDHLQTTHDPLNFTT